MKEISVHEFKERLDNETPDVFLLDVREPFEQYQSKIKYDNSSLIPIGELKNRLDELEEHKSQEIVCLCRSGSRSKQACELLEKNGYPNAKNLQGGINKWAKEIDNSLPVY